jgi:DNA mismatch repair protein MutS2
MAEGLDSAVDGRYAALEYDKIIELLAERASSALGAAETRALTPAANADEISNRLEETAEAVSFIMRKGTPGFGEFGDISGALGYACRGGSLTMEQLLSVAVHLSAARRAASFLKGDAGKGGAHGDGTDGGGADGDAPGTPDGFGGPDRNAPDAPILRGMATALSVHRDVEDRITSSILSGSEMSDGASPELRRIRRQIGVQNENIRAQLNKLITSPSYRDVLRDQIITQRDGRWVVPVRAESAKQVPGIIHDRSKGGATFFIEPQAVVNANNALRELEIEEAQEVARILAELSASVAEIAGELRVNQNVLTRIDFIFAKGLLACDMKAGKPETGEGRVLEIVNGRHPLIDPAAVVPVSLTLGGDYNVLIITGPNTGGKTVTLKTVGLFVLMAHAGLHLPASRAVIPAVKGVFADIGDEQSIEQSLSTFSSHMKNIVGIVGRADRESIVFLDELGAGTDPAEGAALAISILETLGRRGCLVMATTHYTELKKYAIATDGVENASMEFDVGTLSPTFKLRIGLPGRSNAFEISRRLGLPEYIVDRAADSMDSGSVAFETVIEQAETDRRRAEEARQEAERALAAIEAEKDALDMEIRKFEAEKDSILESARSESVGKIAEAREYADIIKAEMKALLDEAGDLIEKAKAGTLTAEDAERAPSRGDFYRRLDENRKAADRLRGELGGGGGKRAGVGRESRSGRGGAAPGSGELRAGDMVHLVTIDADGEVVTPADDKGELQILVGRIRMTVPLADVRAVKGGKGGGRRPRTAVSGISGAAHIQFSKANSVSSSIDLHGYKLDDAILEVDKYIDDAVLAGYGEVAIVHGRGEGILRSGIRWSLRDNRHVRKFRSGGPDEGGDGATIVTLK